MHARGTIREVNHETLEEPTSVETFSIPEAALALGRQELTLRRWIDADKVPAPYLQETVRGYKVYSLGEIETLARVLSTHHSAYLSSTDHHVITQIREHLHAYRTHHI